MVVFASDPHARYPECKIAEQAISVGSEGKCLGYWWQGNLMVNRAVEEDIKKARRSFFHYGAIGVLMTPPAQPACECILCNYQGILPIDSNAQCIERETRTQY